MYSISLHVRKEKPISTLIALNINEKTLQNCYDVTFCDGKMARLIIRIYLVSFMC